jgi:hypothetical protein
MTIKGLLERHRALVVPLALLLVTTICVFVPLAPTMPRAMLDESWGLGINVAVSQHLVFGRDLIFTFGPYASIFNLQYHPATDAMMVLGSLYLALAYWLALAALIRESRRFLPWAMLVVLAGMMTSRDALMMSYPLLVGLVCCRRPAPPAWLAIALCSPFGLMPLVKGSFGVLCALVGAVIVLQLLLEKQWKVAAAVIGAAVVSLVVWWLFAGQPLLALPRYFLEMLPIISGYAEAMGLPGSTLEIVVYVAAAVLLLVLVARDRKWFEAAIYGAYFFVVLKAGFVRHDAHGALCGVAMLVGSIVYLASPDRRHALAVVAAGLVVWFVTDHHYIHTTPRSFASNIEHTYGDAAVGLWRRVSSDYPHDAYADALETVRLDNDVPHLDGTWDVYSYGQTTLIAAGNHYDPRPVLQSYSVYRDDLDAANRAHLEGPHAPDHILFRLESLDWRYPPLDDGGSWPDLLRRYYPRMITSDAVVLDRRPAPLAIQETTLGTATGKLGRRVAVPRSDALVFAEIDVGTSWWGKLAGAFFKPNSLLITTWLGNGQVKTYRFVAGMGKFGILLSPIVETMPEFISLYDGTNLLDSKRVVAFTVSPRDPYHPSDASYRWWQTTFHVTYKALAIPHAPEVKKFLVLDPLGHGPTGPLPEQKCNEVLDEVNGMLGIPPDFEARGVLAVRGWMGDITESGDPVIVLTDTAGNRLVGAPRRVLRRDVAAYFKDSRMARSGYGSTFDISELDGVYTLQVGIKRDNSITVCTPRVYKVTIHATH